MAGQKLVAFPIEGNLDSLRSAPEKLWAETANIQTAGREEEREREREREREQDRLGSASRFPIAINRFILKRATVTENRLDAISATHLFNRAPATIDYPATAKLRALPFTDARTTTCSFSDLFFCRSCCFFSSSLKHLNVASATVGSGRRTADPG